MRRKFPVYYFLPGILVSIFATVLLAQSGSLPYIFNSGDIVSASQINANFASLNSRITASMPVGSVLSSILTPAQFRNQVGDPATFSASSSTWTLADGRSVSGSAYASATGATNIPDMRGMFLRGLNEGRSDGFQDPDTRALGGYQADENKAHNHTNGAYQYLLQSDCNLTTFPTDFTCGEPNLGSVGGMASSGGAESRPRNVAVNFYIKIN